MFYRIALELLLPLSIICCDNNKRLPFITFCLSFSFGFNFRSTSFGMKASRGGSSTSVSKSGSSSRTRCCCSNLLGMETELEGVSWEENWRCMWVGSVLRPSLEFALSLLLLVLLNKCTYTKFSLFSEKHRLTSSLQQSLPEATTLKWDNLEFKHLKQLYYQCTYLLIMSPFKFYICIIIIHGQTNCKII